MSMFADEMRRNQVIDGFGGNMQNIWDHINSLVQNWIMIFVSSHFQFMRYMLLLHAVDCSIAALHRKQINNKIYDWNIIKVDIASPADYAGMQHKGWVMRADECPAKSVRNTNGLKRVRRYKLAFCGMSPRLFCWFEEVQGVGDSSSIIRH